MESSKSDFKLYSTFSSWDEFESAAKAYIDTTFQPFVKGSTKRVEAQNKKCKDKYPISMEYYYKMYSCSHRGKFAPRGLGLRKTKSQKDGCIAKIWARLDSKEKNKIIVTVLDERHNHEIGEHLYRRYAHNRGLTQKEKEHINKLCSLNVPNKDVRREIEMLTGKKLTAQEISNSKKSYRTNWRKNEDDAQMLHPKLEGCIKRDPGWHHDYSRPTTLQPNGDGLSCFETNDWSSQALSKKERYSVIKVKLDDILKNLLEVDANSFNFYMDRLTKLELYISSLTKFSISRFDGASKVAVTSDVETDESSGSGVVHVANGSDVVNVADVNGVVSVVSRTGVDVGVPNVSTLDNKDSDIDADAVNLNKLKLSRNVAKRWRSKDFSTTVVGSPKRSRTLVDK